MRSHWHWCVALWAASAHAQFAGGGGVGGGGLSGMGSANFGGAAIARVTVAPVGGGFGFQNGGGGGLHGVTRRTFMAEPNAAAAQFFSSGGVRLPVQGVPGAAGQPGAGTYFGARQPSGGSIGRVAAASVTTPDQPASAGEPPLPFAPSTAGNHGPTRPPGTPHTLTAGPQRPPASAPAYRAGNNAAPRRGGR